MSRLQKNMKTTVIPGSPGVATVVGSPAVPAYCEVEEVTETNIVTTDLGLSSLGGLVVGDSGDFTPSDGYEAPFSSPYTTGSVSSVTTTRLVTTCYPAKPAVEGTAGVPPVAAQLITSLNYGWNSWARSVNPMAVNNFYLFTVPYGIMGLFIGFDVNRSMGPNIGSFRHGLMIDINGIKVYESGVVKQTIKGTFLSTSRIRICRQADNTIIYAITTEQETLIVKSLVTTLFNLSFLPLYLYGYLYRAGDEARDSEIRTGEIHYGEA